VQNRDILNNLVQAGGDAKVTVTSKFIAKIPASVAFSPLEKEMLHEYCPG
jgi:hypothetical protein